MLAGRPWLAPRHPPPSRPRFSLALPSHPYFVLTEPQPRLATPSLNPDSPAYPRSPAHTAASSSVFTPTPTTSNPTSPTKLAPLGRRLWSLPFWLENCASDITGDNLPKKICEILESCAQMVLQLHDKTQVLGARF